ncbi:MAG: ribulose-phosphate 3-epimerase [Patescibacteria group bacterium]|nr:ribulose-phosphate 3-epimerase [Patescibacteria group bacterium]
MVIIPVANCPDFKCVKKRISQIKEMGSAWVHIDITDNKFTETVTWSEPNDLLKIKNELSGLNIEVHLMIERPEDVLESWLKAGVKRVIVHVEAVNNFEFLKSKCREAQVGLMLALKPTTPISEIYPYFDELEFVQILAVMPGPSGQAFDDCVLEKIRTVKQRASNIVIEVDGGINLETAKSSIEVGAEIITSGSYIFGSRNPEKAYKELTGIS